MDVAFGVLRLNRRAGNQLPVGIRALIEVVTCPEVVAEANIHGQVLVDRDVVLSVAVILLDRCRVAKETAVDDDAGHRRSHLILRQRVLPCGSRREVAAKDRFIDVLQTDFECMIHVGEL